MATKEGKIILEFLAFMVVFLFFHFVEHILDQYCWNVVVGLNIFPLSSYISGVTFFITVVMIQAKTKRVLQCHEGKCMAYHYKHIRP